MSIPQDVLDGQVGAGRLVPLLPLSPRAQILRALFVTERLQALLDGRTTDEITEERFGALRADLEVFVTQPTLFPHYLFWLTPRHDVVWEIRSVEDVPSLRVLGRFADFDVYVGLTIEERAELEGWNSHQWKRAIRTCIQRWGTAFAGYQSHSGGKADDFFSGAISVRYFKK
jgi:hypothetical protein